MLPPVADTETDPSRKPLQLTLSVEGTKTITPGSRTLVSNIVTQPFVESVT